MSGAAASGTAALRERPRTDGLTEAIAGLRRALRRGARVPGGSGLSVAQLEVLTALTEHPGARAGQLAGLLHAQPNTVTTIVTALIAKGMARKATAAADRRAVELTATPAGEAAVARWQAATTAMIARALPSLPAAQRQALLAAGPALDALARAINTQAGAPPELAD